MKSLSGNLSWSPEEIRAVPRTTSIWDKVPAKHPSVSMYTLMHVLQASLSLNVNLRLGYTGRLTGLRTVWLWWFWLVGAGKRLSRFLPLPSLHNHLVLRHILVRFYVCSLIVSVVTVTAQCHPYHQRANAPSIISLGLFSFSLYFQNF